MTARGPVTRTVQRPVKGTRGFRLGLPVGTRPVRVSTLRLGRPRWLYGGDLPPSWAPADTLTIRAVVVDGHIIGQVAGHRPSPNNSARATAYRFRSADGSVILDDWRLEDLRIQIDRAYPEGAELPTPKE